MTDLTRAPGFYDDGNGMRRWWTGQDWGRDYDTAHTADAAVRARNLNQAVGDAVARGWSIEFNDGTRAVLTMRRHMSFLLNLIAVILTGGLWLIYVLVRIASPQNMRLTLVVQPNGTVSRG